MIEEKLSLTQYAKAFQPKEIDAFLLNLPAFSADEIAEISKQTKGQAGNYGTMLGMDALPPPGFYICILFSPLFRNIKYCNFE